MSLSHSTGRALRSTTARRATTFYRARSASKKNWSALLPSHHSEAARCASTKGGSGPR